MCGCEPSGRGGGEGGCAAEKVKTGWWWPTYVAGEDSTAASAPGVVSPSVLSTDLARLGGAKRRRKKERAIWGAGVR
jgi:hypothetical protein